MHNSTIPTFFQQQQQIDTCTKSETIKMEEYSYQKRACCGMPSMLWHTMGNVRFAIELYLKGS